MSRFHDVRLSLRQARAVLALTVAFEVTATLLLKASDGFTLLAPSLGSLLGFSLTTLCLAKVLEVIPTSIAYTVWTGSGSALVATLGVALFGEVITWRAVIGIALVVTGVTVLNFAGARPAEPPM